MLLNNSEKNFKIVRKVWKNLDVEQKIKEFIAYGKEKSCPNNFRIHFC